MKLRSPILLLLNIIMITGLTGCSKGLAPVSPPTSPSKPISILWLDIPPTSLAINASTPVIADVQNTSNPLISWSVTCGSPGSCGSFGSNPSVSDGPNTYKAPSAIPTGGTVTVTATSDADTSKSVSATITISPPIPITVAFQGAPPASLQINTSAAINAKITNDVSANPEVQWSVACLSANCGSFLPATTSNESPTNYTAPPTVPSGTIVTVTATSVADPTKSVSASVTITPVAPTLANGTYVFQLTGSTGAQPGLMTGVFVAQNGTITGGEQDSITYDADAHLFLPQSGPISGGSYATTPDGNIQITLDSSDFYFYSEETLDAVIISGTRALLTGMSGNAASGTLDMQTTTAAPAGGYAFVASGVDASRQAAGLGGILNIDSVGGISGAGSVLDFNDAGNFEGAQTLAASTVSAPDSFGRIVFHLKSTAFPNSDWVDLAGYLMDGTRVRLVETNGDELRGALEGTALAQGAGTGSFRGNSMAGSSYVFSAQCLPSTDVGSFQVAGVLSASTGGNLAGTLNWSNLAESVPQAPTAFTGSYTVDPSGRATLLNLTDGSTFNYQLQLYLAGDGQAMVLSRDPKLMIAGEAFQQQSGAFTADSFSGSYGFSAVQVGNANSNANGLSTAVGQLTAVAGNGTDTLAGFVDFGPVTSDYAVSGSFTPGSNGVFTGAFTGLDPPTTTKANNFTLYFVNPTHAVAIETDNTQKTLGNLELQH